MVCSNYILFEKSVKAELRVTATAPHGTAPTRCCWPCSRGRAAELLAVAIENARLVEQQKQQTEQSAIAAERDRLAAELHANLAQTLGFLNLESDRVRELLGDQQLD